MRVMVRLIRLAFLICGVAASTTMAACSDDDGTETIVRTVPATTAVPINTGIEQLDPTLNAALVADVIELAGLTGYQRVGCVEAQSTEGPPPCREGEAVGTEVEALPSTGCAQRWTRPEQVPDEYRRALGLTRELVAVYRPQAPSYGEEYVAVFRTTVATAAPDASTGVAVGVFGGRVVSLEEPCDFVEDLYADARVAEFIVPPEGD